MRGLISESTLYPIPNSSALPGTKFSNLAFVILQEELNKVASDLYSHHVRSLGQLIHNLFGLLLLEVER